MNIDINVNKYVYAAAKSLQSCPTLCDPIDGSPPGYPHPWDSPGKNTGVDNMLQRRLNLKNILTEKSQ